MKKISTLFDFQRFSDNKRLQALIAETEMRVITRQNQISDDDLECVAAAGEGHAKKLRDQRNDH